MIMPLNMLDLVLMLTRSPGMSHKIWQISQFQVKYPEIFSARKRAKFAQAVSWACYNRLLMRLEKFQTRASKNQAPNSEHCSLTNILNILLGLARSDKVVSNEIKQENERNATHRHLRVSCNTQFLREATKSVSPVVQTLPNVRVTNL